MNAVIIAKIPENIVSLKITNPICFSVNGPAVRINLTKVIGAVLSFVAFSLKSSVCSTGFPLICLCSTTRFTLDKNKNELITAGRSAIAAIISTPPTIAITPYIAPNVNAPESPGKILLGIL